MHRQKRSHHFVSHLGLLTSHHLSPYSGGIQGASLLMDITAGCDFLGFCAQKKFI